MNKIDSPISYPDLGRPSAGLQCGEMLSSLYFLDLMVNQNRVTIPTPSRPENIMLLPGFMTGERSLKPLQKLLMAGGHQAKTWGLGFNHGRLEKLMVPAAVRIRQLARRFDQPVTLVGQSLGGVIARELAREHPSLVKQVITLGSPVVGGPRFTSLLKWKNQFGWDVEQIEEEVKHRFHTPIKAPVTAIYSRRDGVVSWRACIDHWSPNVRHVEVSATHMAMGVSREVIHKLGLILANEEIADDIALDNRIYGALA